MRTPCSPAWWARLSGWAGSAPAEGQGILRRVCAGEAAEAAAAAPVPSPAAEGDDDPAWFAPLLDVAAMRHELLDARLFAS